DEAAGSRDGRLATALEEPAERLPRRNLQVRRLRLPGRQKAAEVLAAFEQVLHLPAVVGRLVEARLRYLLVRQGHAEPRAELAQLLLVELLLLVRDVPALAGLTQAVALDRGGEDDRRRAGVLGGGLEGGVDLLRVVAAAGQLA